MGDDQKWLAKICIAFRVYKQLNPEEAESIDKFIAWLHKEYGFIYKDKQ
jgi:hypothetical protein